VTFEITYTHVTYRFTKEQTVLSNCSICTFSDRICVQINMPPHGNSTKNKQPFFCTKTSTFESIKENIPTISPKQILNKTYEKAGGILELSSMGDVGRNLCQIYNAKCLQSTSSGLISNCNKDLVYDLLEQHYLSEKGFVRSVNFADGVMSSDNQFDDICRFCAVDNPIYGSVLGIDPTFNLGDFYVTPTVYEHKMLLSKVTGKHPYFIGPVLLHQDRKYSMYYYFASEVKKLSSVQMVRRHFHQLSCRFFPTLFTYNVASISEKT